MANYWYDHVHVMCPDPLKTAEFYEKMFGARKESIREWPDGRISLTLDLNGSSILIGQPRIPPKSTKNSREDYSPEDYYGLQHFGLRTDNLEEAVRELKAKGVEIKQEITVPRLLKQEITPLRPGIRIAFLWAPDNVLIELTEIKD
jgi:catechol 2,3-dioxygenase-like lactoylglutathione lyase family enzyme